MMQLLMQIRQTARNFLRNERGVSTLEFTLIVMLVAVAVLASLDSTSGTLQLLIARMSGGLTP